MSEFLDCVTEDTQKRSPVNEMYSIVIEEEVQQQLGFVCKDIGDDKFLAEYPELHPPSQNDLW